MSSRHQNNLFQTNNYSIISKYSSIKAGYYRDALLEKFIEDWLKVKSWKRTAQINRGYAARLMSIDWITRRSIRYEAVDCFIILGAGFDFLPFRLDSDCHQCTWIELDLPEVVSTKSEFVRTSGVLNEEFIEKESGIHSSSSAKYHLVECDLRDLAKLARRLRQVFSLLTTKSRNVAILNEVCLCYIDVDEIRGILTTVIETVRDFAFRVYYIGYEQYRADDKSPFNSVMSEHFSSMNYPLKHFPTAAQLKQLLLGDLRFHHLTIAPIYQIYQSALQEDRESFQSAYREEPFDEYEELHLYLSHYALVTAVLILKDPFTGSPTTSDARAGAKEAELADSLSGLKLRNESTGTILFRPIPALERYGHSSCTIETEHSSSHCIFINGGFGRNLGKTDAPHGRLNDCIVLQSQSDGNVSLTPVGTESIDPNSIRLDRIHGQVASLGANRLFFNGGRQNPHKKDPLNVAFTAKIIDNQLEMLHTFKDCTDFVRWRHKICSHNTSDQFLQVGGLCASNDADPVILWNLSSDKLGASILEIPHIDLFRRHSFAMDTVNRTTVLIVGGLQTLASSKDHPVGAAMNTILWDIRAKKAQMMDYNCANSYGSSIHFINDHQLIKLGGISAGTGLAETTVQLLDLRSHSLVAEDLLSLADQRIILTNAGVCHSKRHREIITTGGGGNYFTFGTRLNTSHLIYIYA